MKICDGDVVSVLPGRSSIQKGKMIQDTIQTLMLLLPPLVTPPRRIVAVKETRTALGFLRWEIHVPSPARSFGYVDIILRDVKLRDCLVHHTRPKVRCCSLDVITDPFKRVIMESR